MTNTDPSHIRIIKKYPNRRLYDTTSSSYITLDGVRQMILECIQLKVIDSKTGDDITHSILIQIIGEQEAKDGVPLFTDQVLQQLIQFYGNSLQGLMGEYLERSINAFMEQQETLRQQMHSVMENNPINISSRVTEKQLCDSSLMSQVSSNSNHYNNDHKPENHSKDPK